MSDGLLTNLLGQSSNATTGLFQGSVFGRAPTRGQRRSALLSQAISSQGQNPYARLGAAFGGLIGMGARAGAERLGIVDQPIEVQEAEAIRRAQQAAAESGIDPARDPEGFLQVVDPFISDFPRVAIRTRRLLADLAGEQPEVSNVRDIETEDRGTVTVGTLNNRLVELTPRGPVPFEGDRDIEEPSRFTARNISLPEIGTVIGQVDKETGRVFYRGQDVTNQARFAPQQIEQGEPGSFDLTQKQEFGIREARVAAQNYANTAEDAIALLEESPDINTFVGRGASIINSLQAEGKALARAAGVEFDEDILEPSNYGEEFRRLGINNRRLQGIITSGAFQAAAASGQVGRSVSDRDMRRFIEEFGASASDPQAFAATLRDSVNRTVRNLRNRSQELYGEDLGQDITFMGEPIGFTQEELRSRSEADLTQAEAEAQAREAINQGADPEAVRQRLIDSGFDASGI